MRKRIWVTLLVCGWLLVPLAATGQNFTMLNFSGFIYESDNTPGVAGFPPSNAGDVLAGVGFIESASAPLFYDMQDYEFTIVFYDLVSLGTYVFGGGLQRIDYAGGYVDVIAQRRDDAGYTAPVYGVEPPNATAPSTFNDGEVFLHGEFYNFYMVYHPTLHAGSFEGRMDWTLGSALGELENPDGYAFAGTVDPYGAQVPLGYDLEAVGHVDFDATVPTIETTWGGIRNLYR